MTDLEMFDQTYHILKRGVLPEVHRLIKGQANSAARLIKTEMELGEDKEIDTVMVMRCKEAYKIIINKYIDAMFECYMSIDYFEHPETENLKREKYVQGKIEELLKDTE